MNNRNLRGGSRALILSSRSIKIKRTLEGIARNFRSFEAFYCIPLIEAGLMDEARNTPNWLRVSMVFLLACLVSCACMRLLVRHHAELRTATFGIVYLVSGLVGSWLTLRAWRRYRSTHCVFALGLFSGLGGSGLYMVL